MKKFVFLFFAFVLVLTACGSGEKFQKGDIKDDFCGVYINYQYCKCAFHNDFCDEIGMKKGAANDYVNAEYNKWVEQERNNFKNNCEENGGIFSRDKCKYCEFPKVAQGGKCIEPEEGDEANDNKEDEEGGCKYDSDCSPICEGSVKWKRGCNPRGNICEKTFDTDCRGEVEYFGELSFPKVCQNGECMRDNEGIGNRKRELEEEKKRLSDEVKDINAKRDDLNSAMMDANKNCINGIADMTNVAIMEFATRIASLSGGFPNFTDVLPDYINDNLNKAYAYMSGEPAEEEKKLKPHEYIKLNCDLYEYFKGMLSETDDELDQAIEEAKKIDEQFNQLP